MKMHLIKIYFNNNPSVFYIALRNTIKYFKNTLINTNNIVYFKIHIYLNKPYIQYINKELEINIILNITYT